MTGMAQGAVPLGLQAPTTEAPGTQAPAAAQGPTEHVTAPTRIGVTGGHQTLLLEEAIQMAVTNNLDVSIQKTQVDSARQAVRAAKGAFDGRFRWRPEYEARNTPTASILQGANGTLSEHFLRQNFAFQQRIPDTGASFGVEFDNARNSSNNPFNSLSPFYTSSLALNLTVPLLRNRATDPDRTEILIRQKQVSSSEVVFEERVIDIATQVAQAYWNLVEAREDEQVEMEAVRLAAEQLAQNERQIRAGTLAPVEVYASRAELERRRDTLIQAASVVAQVENQLKTLLLPDRKDQMWNKELVPGDDKLLTPRGGTELKDSVESALKQRPELRDVRYRQDANALQRKLDRNQILPSINLTGLYTNQGLAGSVSNAVNPFDSLFTDLYTQVNEISATCCAGIVPLPPPSGGTLPPAVIGGYAKAVDAVFTGQYQSILAGLTFDFTVRNRAAKAQLAESTLEGKRLELEQAKTQQMIQADVRNSLQFLESARQRITAAEASVNAAREKLESETRLFQTGESTNFLVLTRQNEYLDSRRRLLAAQGDFNKAVAVFEESAGRTLEAHGIKLR
jgi:outer membrane protein TolC